MAYGLLFFGLTDVMLKIDFGRLEKGAYDGIYVSSEVIEECGKDFGCIKGIRYWSVESLCVFNKDKIVYI